MDGVDDRCVCVCVCVCAHVCLCDGSVLRNVQLIGVRRPIGSRRWPPLLSQLT